MKGLEEMTATANAAVAAGEDVTVTITDMRQVGFINFDPMMEFDATVMPDGRPAYLLTFRQMITQPQLVGLRCGVALPGRVSPGNPSAVWLYLSDGV